MLFLLFPNELVLRSRQASVQRQLPQLQANRNPERTAASPSWCGEKKLAVEIVASLVRPSPHCLMRCDRDNARMNGSLLQEDYFFRTLLTFQWAATSKFLWISPITLIHITCRKPPNSFYLSLSAWEQPLYVSATSRPNPIRRVALMFAPRCDYFVMQIHATAPVKSNCPSTFRKVIWKNKPNTIQSAVVYRTGIFHSCIFSNQQTSSPFWAQSCLCYVE